MLKTSNTNDVITCRGKKLEVFHIVGSRSLTRALMVGSTIFFSHDNPIAIKFKDGRSIMNFQSFGKTTTANKNLLREKGEYKTIPENLFNVELYNVITQKYFGNR